MDRRAPAGQAFRVCPLACHLPIFAQPMIALGLGMVHALTNLWLQVDLYQLNIRELLSVTRVFLSLQHRYLLRAIKDRGLKAVGSVPTEVPLRSLADV